MAAIQEKDVQQAVARLRILCATAGIASEEEVRRVLHALQPCLSQAHEKLGVDSAGKVDSTTWTALSDEEKAMVMDSLAGAERALDAALDVGPVDRSSIMFKTYASNGWVIALTALGVLATSAVIWRIFAYWLPATVEDATESDILRMVIIMGALGGLLHYTSSLAQFIGNRRLQRSWIVYYLLMPFEGAALAPIVYLLLRVGVLAPGTSAEDMNLLGLYAFAALTGLFSKQAIEMLAEVFSVIFKKVKAKDSLNGDRQRPEGTDKRP